MRERINLLSDTTTQPTPEMRRAIAEAPVGDEQRREDPTVNRLVERVSALLGVESAVFLPSATMANQIAFAVHGAGGDELIGHRLSHPFHYEAGGPAYLARLMVRPLDGPRGLFTAEAVQEVLRDPGDPGQQRSRILLVENPTNIGGGAVWPIDRIRAVTDVARQAGLATHMDGARLLNAVVASGVSAADYAAPFDSITLCFSKGLGAPVGAALAGGVDFIEEAWRYKHRFGGAMRQAGILAAAALHALEFHVERLAEDHANARRLAEGLAPLPGIELDPSTVETNIVVFDVAPDRMTAKDLVAKMAEAGVDFYPIGPQTCRLVSHMDVSSAQIDEAIVRFRKVLGKSS
jgi:threonine aldolase